MQAEDLLAKLNDIYLPDRVDSWFPLAYGWWMLLGLIAFVSFVVYVVYLVRKKIATYKQGIINDFRYTVQQSIDYYPEQTLQTISMYLKRICMDKSPKDDITMLYGQPWVDFLDSKIKTKYVTSSAMNMLSNSYAACDLDKVQLQDIMSTSEKWIREML
jgi:hypothetical protein